MFSVLFQTGGRHRCSTIDTEHTYSPFDYSLSSDCWLPSIILTRCYVELVQQSCNTSAADNALIAVLYAERISPDWSDVFTSCDVDVKELVNNVSEHLHQCDVNCFFYCSARWPALRYVRHLRHYLMERRSLSILRTYCSRWDDFTLCINTTGCTFQDIYQYRLSLGSWSYRYQRQYNLTNTTYSFVCSSTEDYRSFYQCLSEHNWNVCDIIDWLKEVYGYEYCTRWLHKVLCRYNSLNIGCNETIAKYVQFQYHLEQIWSSCYSTLTQLLNTTLYEQITEDSNCSEFRYFLCLAQSRLIPDIFFGRENEYSSPISQTNVSQTDVLPVCTELNNLILCVGCNPADPRFPGNSLNVSNLKSHD